AGFGAISFKEASNAQLAHVSKLALYEARNVDHRFAIMADTNTRALSSVPPKKQAIAEKARRKISDIIMAKNRWTLTLFPTAAYAQDAEMSLEEFEDFVYGTVFADKKDPVAEWKKVAKFQDRLIRRLRRVDEVRIIGPDTDLRMSVKGRIWKNSDGRYNMPSGEIFTGPIENTAEGYIRYTYPVCYRGKEVDDVRLVFKKGKVVEASAAKNNSLLQTMIDVDPGARRLGELGIGTNYGIKKFIKNILFDEKIGGSIHLALGMSYKETGGKNRSALHWDMIKDLRQGGKILVDGKPLQKGGKFLI
ncbi:MAG: aminopeptidase, partial [Phycisphaerae bacterium]|nr:aminopeptidase [Phycisphaerae bacterium]